MKEYEVQILLSPSPPVISLSSAGWRNESGEHLLIPEQIRTLKTLPGDMINCAYRHERVLELYRRSMEFLNSKGTSLMRCCPTGYPPVRRTWICREFANPNDKLWKASIYSSQTSSMF